MKERLIKRLTKYYKLERFHVVWISLFGLFLNAKYGWRPTLLLTYGSGLMVLVLAQGTYYWRRKLATVQGKCRQPERVLQQFHCFQWLNVGVIVAYPLLLLLLSARLAHPWAAQTHSGWALFAYISGVAEHVNYYHVQLMYDNRNDWQHLWAYKKLKIAALRKDFNKNTL